MTELDALERKLSQTLDGMVDEVRDDLRKMSEATPYRYRIETYPSDLSFPRGFANRRDARHVARVVADMYGATLGRVSVYDTKAGKVIYTLRYDVEHMRWSEVTPY